jgi:hypothetical protein
MKSIVVRLQRLLGALPLARDAAVEKILRRNRMMLAAPEMLKHFLMTGARIAVAPNAAADHQRSTALITWRREDAHVYNPRTKAKITITTMKSRPMNLIDRHSRRAP